MSNIQQIKDYHGKRVSVLMRNGETAEGALAFYNWEQQVIYLSSYVIFNKDKTEEVDEGQFIIFNQKEWSTLRVK
jgi:hypothetical protein